MCYYNQGLKANTKKQKYHRILERKQATHPELLCRGIFVLIFSIEHHKFVIMLHAVVLNIFYYQGYPSEFKDYFAHCSSLGFEDRPDYR